MTPVDMLDTFEAAHKYGTIFVFIVLPIVGVVLYLAYRQVKSWLDKQANLFEKLNSNCDIFTDMVEEIRGRAERVDGLIIKLSEDTERIASEEHWKSCTVDRCPYLQKFYSELKGATHLIQTFSDEARVSREGTKEAVNTMMKRIDDFAIAVIAALKKNSNGKE